MESIFFLFTASLLAGIVNGVAGGGGLIAFPALLITGIPSINANATNAAALWFEAIIMAFGAMVGAYSSVYLARKLNPLWIRSLIVGVSLSMTCYFFIR